MIHARSAALWLAWAVLILGMGVAGLPLLPWRGATRAWMKLHNRALFWLAWQLCGIRTAVAGPIPQGPVVVAAAHQSLLDVLILFNALPDARFVMKRALLWVPVFGLYAWAMGSMPVARGVGGAGARVLAWAARSGAGAQLVIYPHGTRVAPGARAPIRRGAVLVARRLRRPVVPATTDAGLVWPRRGPCRPGTATVTFAPPLPWTLSDADLVARIDAALHDTP